MLEAWSDFKKKLLNEPNSYITVAGDMMNNGLKNSVTNVYQETMRPRDQKKWLVEQLRDVKDKILCVVPGNHENRFEISQSIQLLSTRKKHDALDSKVTSNHALNFIN